MTCSPPRHGLVRRTHTVWRSPRVVHWRAQVATWQQQPYSGSVVLLVGTLLATLLVIGLNHLLIFIPNSGLVYLPLVALLAYHWNWRYAATATLLQLACVYFFFLPPVNTLKPLTLQSASELVTLAAVTGFLLAIVQLARRRRALAEQAAGRFAALGRVGTALAGELEEERLLQQIAATARELTGAGFAAFTLRPLNELGRPLVPSEGHLFHLAAVVGVTKGQEALFRRMPLGGEGLLAPIFRHGVAVRVTDALAHTPGPEQAAGGQSTAPRDAARQAAFDYAHGQLATAGLRSMGVPRGHPVVRSFLGVPLLDRTGEVRGGLLLGHSEPEQFTQADEDVLVGLAAQAAVALENARLYHAAQVQAQELDAIFESIADGVTLVDDQGGILRENSAARRMREAVQESPAAGDVSEALLHRPAERALQGAVEPSLPVTLVDAQQELREFIVSASPLRQPSRTSGPLRKHEQPADGAAQRVAGAVVVWHDATEARRLLLERRAHAETEARRALLQTVIDELPSGVYLVRGPDARLVLANRATAAVWGAPWPQGQPMSVFLAANGIRVFHVDGRPLAPEEFATLRAVRTGEAVRHHQEIIRHPDGTSLPVLVNAVALDLRALSGSPADEGHEAAAEPGAIVVHQDVTALKEAERLKDEFIGIAAHELRSPLAVIKGFAQMLILQTARGKGPSLAEWQMEAIQDIDQATTRLVELTEDLLDVTRLQAGRLALHPEPTDLVALTRRVVTRLQVTTERHTLSIHADQEYLVAEVDPRRIEQVLGNLVNNAIKYSPEGGCIDIMLREDRQAQSAVLCVADQGIGIPTHQQARIFSRFVRADNAREREIGGTGLGLYLCRELVERHHGRIWFASTEGQGSTFFVSLPLISTPPAAASPGQADEQKGGGRLQ